MGLVVGDETFLSRRDPVFGPGPSGPATCGTPVSATVGVTVGIFVDGSEGSGTATGDVDTVWKGMGAGAWLRLAGLSGGEILAGDVAVSEGGPEI